MKLPRLAFFRGRIVPYGDVRLGVLTHALNYGTGCFAGLRGHWNEEEQELFVFRPRRSLSSASSIRRGSSAWKLDGHGRDPWPDT
mgnify:CR=1 FL=1